MSAGDFLILENVADTATLPNAGTNLDTLWDSTVKSEGAAATYNAGIFTLTNTAPYLIIYSEKFTTTNTTNNERIEGEGRLNINGANVIEGAGEGYIRKSSGQQTMVINGMAIYNATAGDTVKIRFYRGDNSTSGTVSRVANDGGGVQILELDAADDFARYATTAAQTISSTESNVTSWSSPQQEAGFSRTTDTVTISTAGRYLMIFCGTTRETGTARIGSTVFLERGTTEVTGVRGYSHMRGSDGDQNGALSFAAIVDVAANDTFTLRGDADSGSMTLDSGAVWQWWKLPVGNETAIMEATTGDMNPTNATDFVWGTLPYIDSAAFTATAGNANINVDQGSHFLAFWNQGNKAIDSVQRGYPTAYPAVNGSPITYAMSGVYHRNSGGIGAFAAQGGASILETVPLGSSITIQNLGIGAASSINVESGHFSLLKLEGLYKNYSYTFPVSVTDVDTDEIVTNNQTNVVVSGSTFGATQGTGIVELVQLSNYTGNKVTQTVTSWSDTSIQIDIVAGALADSIAYLFVTSDAGGQSYLAVQVGLPPETYSEAILALTPVLQHYWKFQNTALDEIGGASANSNVGGTPTFPLVPIVKGDIYSLLLNGTTDSLSPADQSDMNTSSTAQRRYMGGWIMLDSIGQALSVIWEEGAQVNNYAFLNGFGNASMWQFADDGGDYVQAYNDIKLTPNRPYFVLMEFNSSLQNGGICGCYLDGVKQSRTNGNPWEVSSFPSHSGNISWGHEGTENLQTGDSRGVDNVDIAFSSPVSCYYSHWFSVQDQSYTATQIREQMFEKGALADTTIVGDSTANMQLAVDAKAGTVFPDYPCGIEINSATEGDFTITFDNMTFNSRCSMPIRYTGINILTVILTNGSDVDESKCGTPYGGTILFQRPATFTISNIPIGAEVRIYDDNGVSGNYGTELAGIETSPATTFQYSHSGVTNGIIVQIMENGYVEKDIPFTLSSSNQTLSLDLKVETNE